MAIACDGSSRLYLRAVLRRNGGHRSGRALCRTPVGTPASLGPSPLLEIGLGLGLQVGEAGVPGAGGEWLEEGAGFAEALLLLEEHGAVPENLGVGGLDFEGGGVGAVGKAEVAL